MEKHDILVNMRGRYGADETDFSTLELYAEGTLSKKDGAYIIEYGTNEAPSGGQQLKLVVKDEEIRMQCLGEVETDFLFAEKQCFVTAYPTDEGLMEVTIFPHDISSRLSIERGTIDLDYTIRLGDISTYNKLTIDYRIKQ